MYATSIFCFAVLVALSHGVSGAITCIEGDGSAEYPFKPNQCGEKATGCGTWSCLSPYEGTVKFCSSKDAHQQLCDHFSTKNDDCSSKECQITSMSEPPVPNPPVPNPPAPNPPKTDPGKTDEDGSSSATGQQQPRGVALGLLFAVVPVVLGLVFN